MSKLLSVLMSGSGGGPKKILNLESVGGATYNQTYIYNGSSDTSKYFQTKENIVFTETDTVEFKIKFKVGAGSSPGTGIFCNGNVLTDHLFSFNQRSQVSYYLTTTLNGVMNNMFSWRNYVGQWVIVSLLKSSSNIVATLSVNGSVVSSYTISSNFSMNDKMLFGIGCLEQNIIYTSMQSDVAIDFYGTDILINGESALWTEESNVQFKTYCYAQNNGCILVDKEIDGFRVVGTLINTEQSVSSYTNYYIAGAAAYSSNPSYWLGAFINMPNNQKQKLIAIGYLGGSISEELVSADGTVIKTDFDFERKSYSSYTIAKCGIFANYRIYNNTFDFFTNDFVKIKEIVLYKGNDIVADLKPAIANGESGMYDIIEEKFYGNANLVGSLICE